MGLVRTALVLGLVALSASACGSGRHVAFATSYQTCGLSVRLPPGFHHRSWNFDGGGGITIGDGRRGLTDPAEWVDDPNRVTLSVSGPSAAPRKLQFPITLHELSQGSGIPYWEGGGFLPSGSEGCEVAVWLGPNAPAADRSAVLSVLQAIKPT
jgi:hypothetical protein